MIKTLTVKQHDIMEYYMICGLKFKFDIKN